MNSSPVVGIDVGGTRKGFHAVLLNRGRVLDVRRARDPAALAQWCAECGAEAVAVDAPCMWSADGLSRAAERAIHRVGLHCYYTPTRERAQGRSFYGWVFNGERLYDALKRHYALLDSQWGGGRVCFETFPHAVTCALEGRVVRANDDKAGVRRAALRRLGIADTGLLTSLDFVDAALCAVSAELFGRGLYARYGDDREGCLVVPSHMGL